MKKFIVENLGNIEIFLSKYLANLKIESPFKLIKKRVIYINGVKANTLSKVKNGDEIKIFADVATATFNNLNDIYKIPIIFENDDFIAINKPYNIPSQGGTNISVSIDAIFANYKITHRLDKETQGIMLLAKTLEAAQKLTKAFEERKIEKYYKVEAYFTTKIPMKGEIRDSNGISLYEVIDVKDSIYTMIFKPITGKKHQIRLHILKLKGHILGDLRYTFRDSPYKNITPMRLICYKIVINKSIFDLNKDLFIEL